MCFIFSFKYPTNTALLYRSVYIRGIVRAPERERREAQWILREIPNTKDGVRKKTPREWKALEKLCYGTKSAKKCNNFKQIIWWDSLHAIFRINVTWLPSGKRVLLTVTSARQIILTCEYLNGFVLHFQPGLVCWLFVLICIYWSYNVCFSMKWLFYYRLHITP